MVMDRLRYGTAEYNTGEYDSTWFTSPVQPGGAYAVSTVLWRADQWGTKIEPVATDIPVAGTIDYNEDRTVKRTFSLDVSHPDRLRPFTDYIVPEITLTDAAGNITTRPKGHFLVLPPSTHLTPARYSGAIQGQDVTYLLSRNRIRDGMTISAGWDYGAAARTVILNTWVTPRQVQIPDAGKVIAEPRYYHPGTSRLEIANDLLNAAGFYTVWADDYGVITTAPYRDTQEDTPAVTYTTDRHGATLVPPLDTDPEWGTLRNQVTVRNLQPDKPPVYWTARVENENHPLFRGTVNMVLAGDPVDDHNVTTEDEARVAAERLLAEGASVYERRSVRTVLDLEAGAHEVVGLNLPHRDVVITGSFTRRTWAIQLSGAVGVMDHGLTRNTPWR